MKSTFAGVLLTLSLGLAACERDRVAPDSAQVTVFAAASATDFIQFLRSPEMIDVFEQAGFKVLSAPEDR